MICAHCQTDNPEGAAVCSSCGLQIAPHPFGNEASGDWFERSGRRPFWGVRLGADGIALALVIIAIPCLVPIVWLLTTARINHAISPNSDMTDGRSPANMRNQVSPSSQSPQLSSYKDSAAGSSTGATTDGNDSQAAKPVIKFDQFPALMGSCPVWILRWSVEGATTVTLAGQPQPVTGYAVVKKSDDYKLTATKSDVVVESVKKLRLPPGLKPCEDL
jgi:hypothetical protein